MTVDPARRLAVLESVTHAFGAEIPRHRSSDAVGWARWPDVAALVGHLGGIHRWAAGVVAAGERTPQPRDEPAPADAQRWYSAGRDELLASVRASRPDDPCWVIAGPDRSTGFWWRRMVFETTKHLIDLRAAGGGSWRTAPELGTDDYADGVDELAAVFLERSRDGLHPLPSAVRLVADDTDRRWTFTTDWRVTGDPVAAGAEVRARTSDLALLVWQRADPFRSPERFRVSGSEGAVAAFTAAPIHA